MLRGMLACHGLLHYSPRTTHSTTHSTSHITTHVTTHITTHFTTHVTTALLLTTHVTTRVTTHVTTHVLLLPTLLPTRFYSSPPTAHRVLLTSHCVQPATHTLCRYGGDAGIIAFHYSLDGGK